MKNIKMKNIKMITLPLAIILFLGYKIANKFVILPKFINILFPLIGLILICIGLFVPEKK